jgi:hypothetical protein
VPGGDANRRRQDDRRTVARRHPSAAERAAESSANERQRKSSQRQRYDEDDLYMEEGVTEAGRGARMLDSHLCARRGAHFRMVEAPCSTHAAPSAR